MSAIWDPTYKPRIRPVEAFPVDGEQAGMIAVRDPCQLATAALTVSYPALQVLALMDGETTCEQIRTRFHGIYGRPLSEETLQSLIEKLISVHFLEGPAFEAHYQSLVESYRSSDARPMPEALALGIDEAGVVFDEMLGLAQVRALPGTIHGIIAPHLDYPRGAPCYAAAYHTLRDREPPDRVVILGTNHFGRSASVVATGKDFMTPLGRTRCDVEFLERLEEQCGGSLRECELDHLKEHSIELQVAWVQHLLGSEAFELVPILCPDPCGPTGTAPHNGKGVDLGVFARKLRGLIRDDPKDTLLIAGADLSHTGMHFGDQRPLDDEFLHEVRQRDRRVLTAIEANDPVGLLSRVSEEENPTRVCSAGCIFTLMTALPGTTGTVLDYHQAVTSEIQNCVTCTAAVFTSSP